MAIDIHYGENLSILKTFPDESFELIYIDPPFNTQKEQKRARNSISYSDSFDDYLSFLSPRLEQAKRLLTPNGSLFIHIDYREVHYVKVLLDSIFSDISFMNEIVWAYDYGARSKKRWSTKHDNILWYVKNSNKYKFNYDEMDRIPYMAPGLVGPEKAERGKTPTDVWWHTIVPTNGKEKTGYPTQKPLGVLERIIKVHSEPGDVVLDFFAGSGTAGEAAAKHGRSSVLIDENIDAVEIMIERLAKWNPKLYERGELIPWQ